ncbi:hypothetical protein Q7P35_012284 [Cladosporium inversicolor]
MYANAAIQFRDPFAARDSTINRQPHNYASSRANWTSYTNTQDLNRSLTPPPDMNNVSHAPQHVAHQDYSQRYNNHMSSHSTYRAPLANYPSHEPSTANHVVESRDAKVSPTTQTRASALDSAIETHSRVHKPNHTAIAPSFQIPKSVNDSGGSLSELAAEITCLFWFESSDLLQQIEDSPISLQPPRKLCKDATPTTGFRKWVTTILSTTLVAQNVVLLALLFVYRLKKLNPAVKGKPGSEYRLLTVALMLGNKFLDDNTYTNKTWAEVSGINVAEVHIMEVEFLSNMKYNLFTDVDDWSKWQSLLGKYASFLDRAANPPPVQTRPVPILPPASSLQLPMALPSPPASNQASPPYAGEVAHTGFGYNANNSHGPTPAPSPLSLMPVSNTSYTESKKRSRDDSATEPPAKRLASGLQDYASPRYPTNVSHNSRLTLPSLPIPTSSASSGNGPMPISQTHHLPPLNVPARAMGMVFPSTTGASHVHAGVTAGPSSQPASQMNSQYQSRQQSPYPGSAGASPTNGLQPSAAALHPPTQVSPTYFLQQRNSPYRPVHNVSTLLYPPPSGALQHRPQNTEFQRMRYQPLGKSVQQPQTGHLPYVAQNVWLDGNQQHAMTPVHQWPGFANQ